MADESLTEPRVTMEWLLPTRNSLSDLPAFLGPNGILNPVIFLADFLLQKINKMHILEE